MEKSIEGVARLNVGVTLSSKAFSLTTTDATFRSSAIFEWKSNLMNRTVALFLESIIWSQVIDVDASVDKEIQNQSMIADNCR